ncbi:MAG: SusC/RagA family TonB-linked outer membrane protein [Fulvivirga sp.]
MKRLSARLNLEHKVNDKLNFGTNLTLSKSEIFETTRDNSIYSPWSQALQGRPDEPVFNDDGTFAVVSVNNPVQMFEPDYITNLYSAVGNLYAEYELFEGLKFKTNLGTNTVYTKDFSYSPTTHPTGAGSIAGAGTASNALRTNWLTENTLSYAKELMGGDLSLNALLGFTYQEDTRERSSVAGQGFPSDFFKYLSVAATITTGSSDWTSNSLESLLGRVNLDYQDKYLLSATIRRDGSSKFGRNNRYGVFPSASFGWRISAEDFMQNVDLVQDLKFRASYGVTGNQASIGNFTSLSLIGAGENYNGQPGFGGTVLGNPDLTWEETVQLNLGIDASILDGRLNIALDYYNKKTNDLLLAVPIPYESGFSTIQKNIGEVENKGFEISLNSINIDNGGFRWESSFNLSRNVNEVLKLDQDNPISAGFVSQTEVGQPIGSFFIINAQGVDPQTGDMIYEDIPDEDGNPANGTIGSEDRQHMGSPWPDFVGGLTNNLSYKGFDFSFFFQYSFGNDVYKIYEEGLNGTANLGAAIDPNGLGVTPANMTTDMLGRWRNPGDNTSIPRAVAGAQGIYNTQRSSRFLEDGSYVRLKNITLGYNLPRTVLDKVGVRSFRVYVTGQNLLTFTDYSGFDPEVSSSLDDRQIGVDNGAIPQLKSYIFGLNIGL